MLLSPLAFAGGSPPQQRQDQGQQQGQKQSQQQQQKSLSQAKAVNGDQENNQNISIGGDDYKRQAPSIGVFIPPATAECMGSWGIGATAPVGSLGGGRTKLQKDCFAMQRFRLLQEMGLYEEAAKAYCSRALMIADFADQQQCEFKISTAITPTVRTIQIRLDARKACDTAIRQVRASDGTMIEYMCDEGTEVTGKGS